MTREELHTLLVLVGAPGGPWWSPTWLWGVRERHGTCRATFSALDPKTPCLWVGVPLAQRPTVVAEYEAQYGLPAGCLDEIFGFSDDS